MALFFGGSGVLPDLKGAVTNVVTLQAGAVYPLPNDWIETRTGKYTCIQEFDPIIQAYRSVGGGNTNATLERVKGDGNNYRLANQTSCVVGALITNAGTGYTSAPAVAASSGSSIWRAIVGGAINTSVTVSNGGTNYTYPPLVQIAVPPAGGIQATAHCALTSGAVSSVTVDDQGAGYTSPPQIVFVNDPREGLNGVTLGSGAAAVASLTGSGTITGLICIDHGLPFSGNTVPTLSFTGGGGASAAATAIVCWSITAYTVSTTTAGSGYATPVIMSAIGGFPGTAAIYVNVSTQSQLVKTRPALIQGAVSGTAVTATGQTVFDGGIYAGLPTMFAYGFIPGAGAVQAVLTPTMGGQTDISIVLTT